MKKLDKIIKWLTLVQIIISITLNVLTFLGIKPQLKKSEHPEPDKVVIIENDEKETETS